MKAKTKKFATYQDLYSHTLAILEVRDEQDAVESAPNNTLRFIMHEQTFKKLAGEILKGEPKNHTPYIYPNVEKLFDLNSRIASAKKTLDILESMAAEGIQISGAYNHVADMSRLNEELNTLANMDPATCFIKEPRQGGKFICLGAGEKAYNAQGQQLHPAPAQDVAPDVTPAL